MISSNIELFPTEMNVDIHLFKLMSDQIAINVLSF